MDEIKTSLPKLGYKGEFDDSEESRIKFSHDASMFEIKPKLITSPRDAKDVELLVKYINDNKKTNPELSLTARSAGTDMSGGAINDSIIVDFVKHFNKIHEIKPTYIKTQPGVYYRDFDKISRENGTLMPSYPASRDLCTLGGMVSNNAGGEKSIEVGKTADFVKELHVVFADGVERVVKPLTKKELDKKMFQNDFEGQIYKKTFDLIEKHYDEIKKAKPNVLKNSTGYALWDVWDREKEIFDMTRLVVGSQGTLGFVTDIKIKVNPARSDDGVLVIFLKDLKNLSALINKVLESDPARFEAFDDQTLWLTFKFMPSFLKILGPVKFLKLISNLIPNGLQLLRGMPKLVMIISFKASDPEEIKQKVKALHTELAKDKKLYRIDSFEEAPTLEASEKFWIMRRYSFQLLRSKVKDKHTAPFIDDFVVPPENLKEFLPKISKIIKKYKLFATIAGHIGDGNFHIIPLMKLDDPKDRAKILPVMKEVNNLVLQYGGSLSGEHNDGLVRGPWLEKQYGKSMLNIFKEVKEIFDPKHIFNPRKKANANWDYSFSHIRKNFDE